jgi:hypothetical protein
VRPRIISSYRCAAAGADIGLSVLQDCAAILAKAFTQ